MFSNFKNTAKQHVRNIPGWRTKRKIVIFESDDWGAIRMPSKEVYNKLLSKGFKVDQNPFNRNDALESNEDLEALYEVLTKYRDKNNKHPIFTALTIVANPNFEKIKTNGFKQYEYESVLETLKEYGASHDNVYNLWQEGIESKIFHPEYHGREHVNVKRWMQAINIEGSTSRKTVDYHFYGLGPEEADENRENHFPAFDLDIKNDLKDHKEIIREGIELFHQIFNYKARFFVPPNFLCHESIEQYIHDFGIEFLTGSRKHMHPVGFGQYKKSIRYTGKKNKIGQVYIIRNSQFEYSQTNDINEWQKTIKDIEAAFFWHKPAIISTHRLNYIGYINENNRKEGLNQLDLLLKNIVKKWPDVEFMTTSQLGDSILKNEK